MMTAVTVAATMRSHLRLASFWLSVAIGAAAAGCSASLVAPTDDAGQGPTVAGDAATVTASVDASVWRDASEVPPVGAIIYPSPYNLGNSVLALSNEPISCANRTPMFKCAIGATSVSYLVAVEIPADDVVPGSFSMSSLINPYFSDTGANAGDPMSCWGGGGSFGEGTLEILSVSNLAVVFQFQGTSAYDFDVNGPTFVAQVCPGA
jgi:hypothetical protein